MTSDNIDTTEVGIFLNDAAVSKSLFYVVSSPNLAPIFSQNWDALKAALQRNP